MPFDPVTMLGVSTFGNLGLGLLSTASNNYWAGKNYNAQQEWNQKNLEFQQQKFDYDKQIQQQIFSREDTAVQRRVDDLNAAGLSPLLAAGSGANAGSIVPTTAPQGEAPQFDMSGINESMSQLQGGIASAAELANNVFKAQTDRQLQEAQVENLQKQNALIDKQMDKLVMDTLTGNYSLDYARARGLPLNSTPLERAIGTAIQYLRGKVGSGSGSSGNLLQDGENVGKAAVKAVQNYFGTKVQERVDEIDQKREEKAQEKAAKAAEKAEEKLLEEQNRKAKQDELDQRIKAMNSGTSVHAFTNKYNTWKEYLEKEYNYVLNKY